MFKPALRYDAAQRAVTRLLEPIMKAEGATAEIEVGAHPQHGTFMTVKISGPEEVRERTMQQAKAKLDTLTLRYEAQWAEAGSQQEQAA